MNKGKFTDWFMENKWITKEGPLTMPKLFLSIYGVRFPMEIELMQGARSADGMEWVYCDATTARVTVWKTEEPTSLEDRMFFFETTISGETLEAGGFYEHFEKIIMMHLKQMIYSGVKIEGGEL